MRKESLKKIYIFADWEGLECQKLMGTLNVLLTRGKEVFSFEYDDDWLEEKYRYIFDPDLEFYSGPQYLENSKKKNFGVFLDSSPDRWGRLLMRRREAILARKGKRTQEKLLESDYLLGVHDSNRMGGLRYKLSLKGNFLDDNTELASPPWTSLRDLEFASLQLEKDDAHQDKSCCDFIGVKTKYIRR